MTHEHGLGTVARLASRHLRLLPVLALVLTTSGALFAAAPVANDDVYGGQKDKTLTVDAANGVLANDTDAEDDPLTAVLVDGSAADAKGTLVLNSDGSFTFDPDDNTTYITTFTYKANDGADSNTVTVVISISNNGKLPEPPIASFSVDDATVAAGTTVNFDGSTSELVDGASLDNFIWNYGEGGGTDDTGATDTTSHQYNTPGLFIASLTVKDDIPLTSETAFLPILVSNGTTGDGRLYVKKAQFAISWSKHAGGVDADKFKISGVWNPSGFPANLDLSGMTVDVLINGQSVDGPVALDASGKFASLKGASPSLKFAFKAKNGAFSLSGSLLDLRGFLGVVDQNDDTTLPIAMEVILGTVLPDNFDCIAQLNALYKSTKGKSAKASYAFAKNATPTGTFVSLKTSGTENPDTGGHKISASGVIAGDLGTPISPDGDITIDIGGAAQIVVPASGGYVTTGDTDALKVTTLVKGAVPELAKFTISNPKGKFQLATNELTAVGLDLAGVGGTSDDLAITIFVPTASGDLTFTTSVELLRKDINSTKWKR